jgi:hypothetical protein
MDEHDWETDHEADLVLAGEELPKRALYATHVSRLRF